MPPLLRKLLVWVGVPLAVLFAAHASWLMTTKAAFEERLEALRARGEPIRPADLAPAEVPPGENGAPTLLRARSWYETNAHEPSAVYDDPTSWGDAERADVEAWVRRCEPYVELLKRGVEKPHTVFEHDWSDPLNMGMPSIPLLQDAARLLQQRARLPGTEVESIALLLDVSENDEPASAINMLVRQTAVGCAFEALRTAGGRPGFDAKAARAALEGRFRKSLRPGELERALRFERAFGLSLYEKWFDGDTRWFPLVVPLGGSSGPDLAPLLGGYPGLPLAYRDAAEFLDVIEEAIGIAARGGSLAEWQRFNDRIERYGSTYVGTKSFGIMWHRIYRETEKHKSRVRAALRGLRALEHKQSTGRWPDGETGRIEEGDVVWELEAAPKKR